MDAFTTTIADIAGVCGISRRSLTGWLRGLPHSPRTPVRRYALNDVTVALRRRRRRGLSEGAAAELARRCSPSARATRADLRVIADPMAFLSALSPAEAERAHALVRKAKAGLVAHLWEKVTPELVAACERVVLHPAATCAIFGDSTALPAPESFPAFATAFALANASPRPSTKELQK